MSLKSITRGGVELDLGAVESALIAPAAGSAIERAVRRLLRSRAQKRAWNEEQTAANAEAFEALAAAGVESVTVTLDAEREVDATPAESEVRAFSVVAARSTLTGSVLDSVLKPEAIDPERFDAAVKAGVISAEQAAAIVSVARTTLNVTLTERTVAVELA
jgi:hypothetical protein